MPDPFLPPPDNPALPPQGVQDRVRALAAALLNTAAAPGRALQSTTPITTEEMIKPATDLAMMTTLGAGAIPAEANAARMGIKAYHGSPYNFDRFDRSRIGTGEGSGDFGIGVNATENARIAEVYKNALAKREGGPGYMYDLEINAQPDRFLEYNKRLGQQSPFVQDAIKTIVSDKPLGYIYKDDGKYIARAAPTYSGHLPKKIGEASDEELARNALTEYYTSRAMPRDLADALRTKGGMSDILRDAGIAGTTYQQNHNLYYRSLGDMRPWADAGYPTGRNYVVFDDKLIDILRKYGIAGVSPGALGATLMKQSDGQL